MYPEGILDTSVVIDFEVVPDEALPAVPYVSSITLAELAAGPMATDDLGERARRQDRLQRVEEGFRTIPFDDAAARAYGRVYAATVELGRSPRGRAVDLLIAATAVATGLPLYTRNPKDLHGLDDLVEIITV